MGYYSNWAPCDIEWQTAARARDPLLAACRSSREGRVFDWFAMGWAHYSLTPSVGGYDLIASDLRYGFDTDPRRSVFSLSTRLDLAGLLLPPIHVSRDLPLDGGSALTNLLSASYAPACRFLQ